jgi:hypothetical protein
MSNLYEKIIPKLFREAAKLIAMFRKARPYSTMELNLNRSTGSNVDSKKG